MSNLPRIRPRLLLDEGLRLGDHRYGKDQIELIDLREHSGYEPARMVVDIAVTGGLEGCYLTGHNDLLVTTDALRDLVVTAVVDASPAAAARAEDLACSIARWVETRYPHLPSVDVAVSRHPLQLVRQRSGNAVYAVMPVTEHGSARASSATSCGSPVVGGIDGLTVALRGRHRFAGFIDDQWCPTSPAQRRVIAGELDARWAWCRASTALDRSGDDLVRRVLAALARSSESIQHLLTAVAGDVLRHHEAMATMTLQFHSRPILPSPAAAERGFSGMDMHDGTDSAHLTVVHMAPGPVSTTEVTVERSAAASGDGHWPATQRVSNGADQSVGDLAARGSARE